MSDETYITIVGRLTEDPQLRFTPSGAAVTNYTVAVTARRFDKQTNEWVDKTTRFWKCEAWNSGKLTLAENVAEGLKKGDNVIAYGEIEPRNFETKEGEKRTVVELRIEAIGKNLKFHKPSIQNAPQQNAPQQNAPQQGGGNANTYEPGGWGNSPQQQQQQQQAPQNQQGGGGWQQPSQPQQGQQGNGGGWQAPPQNAPQQNAQPQQGRGGGWNAPSNDPWTQEANPNGGWGNPPSN